MGFCFLAASILCFAASFTYSIVSLALRRYRASRRNYALIAAGFVALSAFLHLRGVETGHCPVTTPFDILLFLSWSMALIYLVVGTGYRMTLLGAFTSPVVILMQLGALALRHSAEAKPLVARPPNLWLEVHAAFSVIAYGAFGLAAIAGVMFLMQERRLKTRNVTGLTAHLPAIRDLGTMNGRLMLLGFLLLSGGLASGFLVGRPTGTLKLAGGVVVWIVYGLILQSRWLRSLAPKAAAKLSIMAFGASLISLWATQLVIVEAAP